MKRIGILAMLLLALHSCEKESPEVFFRIETNGFHLENGPDSEGVDQFSFRHRLSGGWITFRDDTRSFEFLLDDTPLEEHLFSVPEGEYLLEIRHDPASIYGQPLGSFTYRPGNVTISAATDTLQIRVEPNCSLLLVNDEHEQLEDGMYFIEKHFISPGYVVPHPLARDTVSGMYYAYFTPDTANSAPTSFLWFYGPDDAADGEGLSTVNFNLGYQYLITVLE